MEITVKTVAFHPPMAPCEPAGGKYLVTLPPAACPADVLPLFGVERDETLVAMRNGNVAGWEDSLADGDELLLMRAIYGG